MENLKKSHGEKYTPMQYRLWSEMISGGIHRSMTDPPKTAMFSRCGESSNKKGSSVEVMANAVQKLASAINTPRATDQIMEKSTSLIDSRSKRYQQLTELKNLKDSGVLSESEYTDERDAILKVLKTLVNNDS